MIKFDFLENKDNKNPRQRVIVTEDDFFLPTNFFSFALSDDRWRKLCRNERIAMILNDNILFISMNNLIKSCSSISEWKQELKDILKLLEAKKTKVGPQPFAYKAIIIAHY